MPGRSRWLGHLRLGLVYLLIVFLIVVARPTPLTLGIGAALALLGEAVRIWAAGHLVKSVELITSGPYARCQNPLYLGRLLILTGLGLAAHIEGYLNLVAIAVGYAVFFLYYMPRKLRVEGARLARFHGEAFAAYHKSVPILIPSLRRYHGGERSWSFRLMVRNQELLVLSGILIALGALLWKTTHG